MPCKHANLKNTLGYEQGAIGVVCVCIKGFPIIPRDWLGGHVVVCNISM